MDTKHASKDRAPRKTCTFQGCGGPSVARGICRSHYSQFQRGQELSPIVVRQQPGECSFPGCTKIAKVRGICDGHHCQVRAGKPLTPLRQRGIHIGCKFPGCERKHRTMGYCAPHYCQVLYTGKTQAIRPTAKPGRVCRFNGCGRTVKLTDLCSVHRRREFAGLPLFPIKPKAPRPLIPNQAMPGTMLVPLTHGRFAIVDEIDAEIVSQRAWRFRPDGYVTGSLWLSERSRPGENILLHRLVGKRMGLSLKAHVDRRNCDPLDCRRSNLRDATPAENSRNTHARTSNSLGIKGVHFAPREGKFVAQIKDDKGKARRIGSFVTAQEAAEAYERAAAIYHGEFARVA